MHGSGCHDSLVEFAFVSKASHGLPPAAILRIARQSWSYNTRNDLTGTLRFAAGRFEQVIEGRCAVVLRLAARILGDPRHAGISVTAFGPLPARRFADWTLAGFELEAELETARAEAANVRRLVPAESPPAGLAPRAEVAS